MLHGYFEADVQSRNCMYGHFCRQGDSLRKPSVPDFGINLIELDEEVVQIMRSLKAHKSQRGFCRQRR
jgi:hypothetical protein